MTKEERFEWLHRLDKTKPYTIFKLRARDATDDEIKNMERLFDTRTAHVLLRSGIYSLEDLDGLSYSDLLSLHDMGVTRLNKIVDKCKQYNIEIICDIEKDTMVCPCCGYRFVAKEG